MIVKYYEISCDSCGIGEHPVANSIKETESISKIEGWIICNIGDYKGKHYCCKKCYDQRLEKGQ